MRLFNTRDIAQSVEFSEAIVSPMASGGGLFAPRELPKFTPEELAQLRATTAQSATPNATLNAAQNQSPAGLNLPQNHAPAKAPNSSPAGLNYSDLAMKIIDKFEFDLPRDEFLRALAAYDEFDGGEAVGLRQIAPNLWMSELWHGKTRAFKDIALAPFGRLLDGLGERTKRRFLVLCATSGDTGPATLSAFSGAKNVLVFCIYPAGATSAAQRLQMTTARGENLVSVGIRGNFDDAQRALKSLLANESLKKTIFAERGGLNISAANSVNFGRILFQIIYHFWGALRATCSARYNNVSQNGANSNLAGADGENRGETTAIADIIVPSGNFGDALGAFYAKQMGAPIGKILIASNANNILTELFTAGRYDLRGRALIPTISPAMDILVSSNVERLLFAKFGWQRTRELMAHLAARGFYELAADELAALRADFDARFYTDEQTAAAIGLAAGAGELIDPHTATCFAFLAGNGGASSTGGVSGAAGANSNLGVAGGFAGVVCPPVRPTIITSTAQWVKFTPSMLRAIKGAESSNSNLDANVGAAEEFAQMQTLAGEFGVTLPPQICEIFTGEVRHKQVVEVGELEGVLLAWAKRKI